MDFIEAQAKDAQQCLEMIADFYAMYNYPFHKETSQRVFSEFIANEQLGRFWLICQDREVLGYLILAFGYSFEYGGKDAFIDEFYLKSEYRNQGLGTEVMEKLVHEAHALGVNALHLEGEHTNTAGSKLYSKSGFRGNNRSLLTKIIS